MKKTRLTKVIAFAIAAIMLFGILPLSALATETDFASETHEVFSTTASTIAPGVTQSINYAYANDGKQMVYYVATADINRDDVIVQSGYKDAQATVFGMSKLREQMAAADAKFSDPDNAEFISEYYTAVAGVNADFYNMTTGQPSGAFVMNGVMSSSKANNRPWFAIFEDGTALCGYNNTDWDAAVAEHGAVQQAVGGSQVLVKDGADVTASASGSYNTDRHSRTCVGVTADGKVVMMVLDGRQEPFSCGGTMHELAQIMLEQGCVIAINLDGGGSTTFAARQEGENEVSVVNRPSDGSERSISSGLIIASLAAPSDTFDRASLKAESEYVTPGSAVNVTATGVSPAGTAAVIPDNAVWQMADASMGTVVDGVFTASDKTGAAVIQMAVDGKVVGETTVNVVIPDKIVFNSAVVTVPYAKTVILDVTATYGLNKVTLKASDVTFTLSDNALGTVNGFEFTACEENEAVTEGTVTVTLNANEAVTAAATLNLGKGSEVVADFESGVLPDSYNIITGYPQYGPSGANGQNEIGELYIVNTENGQVHDGQYAMAVECDYSQAYETGYHLLNLKGLNLKVPAKAQTIGMWLYLPELEELYTTSMRFVGTSASGSTINSPWLWDNCQPYGWENDGWRYVTMDISGYSEDITFTAFQIYICDRDNTEIGFIFKDHASVNGKFTYYMDSITVDYSSAVDDREPPVFSSVRYADESMSDAVELNGQTVSSNKISFGAVVHENTEKTNYTGLDDNSIKAYIDGVAVDFTYSGGTISLQDVVLADGVHTIRFEAADMMGNKSYVERQINISAGSDIPTVAIVPQNPSADKILIGSLYWVNLEATSAKDVKTATVTFNLNSMSQWELDHMIATPGFRAEYAYDEVNNNATITVTKIGDVAEDATVLVQIPIRTWESRLTEYPGYEDQTPEKLWSRKIIWPIDIKLSADYGAVSFADGTSGSFSMAPIAVITELYGNYAELNENGDYANKTSWHIHTATAVADVDATCTTDGYAGRTYCDVCASVVDWGTAILATGHTFTVVDGVLKCSCGELLNGEYTDGKTYVEGVVANGWLDNSYFTDGTKLTGINEVDGYYYNFGDDGVSQGKYTGIFRDEAANVYRYSQLGVISSGWKLIDGEWYYFRQSTFAAVTGEYTYSGITYTFDDEGKLTSGVWVTSDNGTRYYYAASYYYKAGSAASVTFATIDGKEYGFDKSGYMYKDGLYSLKLSNQKHLTFYTFDENGVCAGLFDLTGYTGLVETVNEGIYYYEDGALSHAGIVKIDNNYYYAGTGGVVVRNTSKLVYPGYTNGIIPPGTYEFDASGRMKYQNGVYEQDGQLYYFVNGEKTHAGMIEFDGNLYYAGTGGVVVRNTSKFVYIGYANGLVPPGVYEFGDDGKLLRLNGIHERDGVLYYFENGIKIHAGVIKIDNAYYYAATGGVIVRNTSKIVYSDYANGLVVPGTYEFEADGKMKYVSGVQEQNGVLYYFEKGVKTHAGIVKIDGEIYYAGTGGVVVRNTSKLVYPGYTNGIIPPGTYEFDADGKMKYANGIHEIDGTLYYLVDAVKTHAGVIEIDGCYYYAATGGVIVRNTSKFVYFGYANGLVAPGTYEFDVSGKMIID